MDAKCRQCRREGQKLYLKGERCFTPKCPIVRRQTTPGVHPQEISRIRLTPYGIQLRAKQAAKRTYGLSERQFRNIFEKVVKKQGNTGELMFGSLEQRLDNVLYRSGLARSRAEARQLIVHGHVLVNGKKVDIPSYSVRISETISMHDGSRPKSTDIGRDREIPNWLQWNADAKQVKVLAIPNAAHMNNDLKFNTIVEFYSR